MNAFTEGQWSVENEEIGGQVTSDLCILGPSPDFRMVAVVSRCFQVERIPAMEAANARLIAAAPELLSACQAVNDAIGHSATVKAYGLIADAIARATGAAA